VCAKIKPDFDVGNKNKINVRAKTTNRVGPDWTSALLLIFLGQSEWEQASSVNSFGFEIFLCV
jgi:hypothetical protein